VQVNDKKTSVRQREVWFMLYSSSEKKKNQREEPQLQRAGPLPYFALLFPPWHTYIPHHFSWRPFVPPGHGCICRYMRNYFLQGNANSEYVVGR
jgi:hypothetical protein